LAAVVVMTCILTVVLGAVSRTHAQAPCRGPNILEVVAIVGGRQEPDAVRVAPGSILTVRVLLTSVQAPNDSPGVGLSFGLAHDPRVLAYEDHTESSGLVDIQDNDFVPINIVTWNQDCGGRVEGVAEERDLDSKCRVIGLAQVMGSCPGLCQGLNPPQDGVPLLEVRYRVVGEPDTSALVDVVSTMLGGFNVPCYSDARIDRLAEVAMVTQFGQARREGCVEERDCPPADPPSCPVLESECMQVENLRVTVRPPSAPDIAVPARLDCGVQEVGSSRECTLTIRNEGTAPLEIQSMVLDPADGGFRSAGSIPILQGSPHDIVAGHFDQEGNADVALALELPNANDPSLVALFRGDGNGTFTRCVSTNLAPNTNPVAIAVANCDMNSDSDLLVANAGTRCVSVLDAQPSCAFVAVPGCLATGGDPLGVLAADLDGDGREEVVTANSGGGGPGTIMVHRALGDCGFAEDPSFQVGGQPAATPESIVAADFNRDGNLDLATANGSTNDVAVLLGNGDRTFRTARFFAVGLEPRDIAAADFDGDGIGDLATANRASGTVSVLKGISDGTFAARRDFDVPAKEPFGLEAARLDSDDKPDLVSVNFGSGNVSVLLNRSTTAQIDFAPGQNYGVGLAPRAVAVEDFNGDNVLDLVTANSSSNDFSVCLGNAAGAFSLLSPPVPFEVPAAPGGNDREVRLLFRPRSPGTLTATLTIQSNDADESSVSVELRGEGVPADQTFRRGDADADASLTITDAIFVLNFLFLGGRVPPCQRAADSDDNDRVELTDAVFTLNHLFRGGQGFPPPFPDCGSQPAARKRTCTSFPPCP
jgi:hypothetical protein